MITDPTLKEIREHIGILERMEKAGFPPEIEKKIAYAKTKGYLLGIYMAKVGMFKKDFLRDIKAI